MSIIFSFIPYFYGYDRTILWLLPFLLLTMYASWKVNHSFKKYSQIASKRGYRAEEACRKMLDARGLYHIKIEKISGNLTDHYDPRAGIIRLSDDVYGQTSQAAIAVACHEAGHAYQHADKYAPLYLRNSIITVTNIGSTLAMPLILAGLLLPYKGMIILAYIGIIAFSLSTVFQLLTLPTEFDASKRALVAIKNNYLLYDDELRGAKKVLDAAALTYVAALATSVVQLLRLIYIVNNRSSND